MQQIVGIGSDITECLRIARLIERHGELFLHRVFTAEEIRYCQSRSQATQHFTARWAAKEAILKALGATWRAGVAWRDMEVRADSHGRPFVVLSGGVLELAQRMGVVRILVSLAHCRNYATACAVAIGKAEG